MFSHSMSTVKTTAAAHDTTGGMETKIAEAAMIARLGIDVYIVKVMTLCYNFTYSFSIYVLRVFSD